MSGIEAVGVTSQAATRSGAAEQSLRGQVACGRGDIDER